MANATKNETTVTNGTKIEGTAFETPYKSGGGLEWREAKKTWEDTEETWEDMEEDTWDNQSKS